MGKVLNSEAHLSGVVGDLIYYHRNGHTYVRKRPVASAKAKPASATCSPGLNRFKQCSLTFKFLSPELLLPWKRAAQGKPYNCRNLFIQANIHAFQAEGADPYFERLQFSCGNLPLPPGMRLSPAGEEGEWQLDWIPAEEFPYTSPADRLRIVVIRTDHPQVVSPIRKLMAARRDASCRFTLPRESGVGTHLYCFFGNAHDTVFSACKYFYVEG